MFSRIDENYGSNKVDPTYRFGSRDPELTLLSFSICASEGILLSFIFAL